MPRALQARLDDLAVAVIEMADLVVGRLRSALRALTEDDSERARNVRDGDDAVNERYLAIERQCIDIIALRQPVAGDLRQVAASFKILTDLERVGDIAVNLAEYALAADRELLPEVDVTGIANVAIEMLESAMRAYREGCLERRDRTDGSASEGSRWQCHEVADRDTDLDALCTHAGTVIVRSLVEATDDDVDDLLEGVQVLMLTVRDLERVGDHATRSRSRTVSMST